MTDITNTDAEAKESTQGALPGDHDPAPAEPSNTPPTNPDAAPDDKPLEDEAAEAERLMRLDMETEDDKANTPLDTGVWGSVGHAVADEALRTLQNAGLSVDDAKALLLDAAIARDPSKVDQKALAAKIGPRRAKAIMASLAAFSRDMRQRDTRLNNELCEHANGPDEFRRLIWGAMDRLPEAEVQAYIAQMGKGGNSARRAIESLQAIVSGQAGTASGSSLRAAPAPVQRSVTPAQRPAGITSKAYLDALKALHGSGRLSFEARDRREAELHEARRIGRMNGLK